MYLTNQEPYQQLLRAAKLSEADAWFDSLRDRGLIEKILDFVREDQLRERGVDENDEIIGFYSIATEILSGGDKHAGDPYTLYDTGEFYSSMFITVLRDSFIINADAQKDDDNLFEKYGEGIIGLTDDNLQKVIEELKTKYINYARNVLFNG